MSLSENLEQALTPVPQKATSALEYDVVVLGTGEGDVARFCQPVITEDFSTSANSLGVR